MRMTADNIVIFIEFMTCITNPGILHLYCTVIHTVYFDSFNYVCCMHQLLESPL